MLDFRVFQILSKRHYAEIQFWASLKMFILSYHDRLQPPPPPPPKKEKNHVIIVNIFVQQS